MAGYTKLFSSIIHSTIWREPPEVCKVWVTMLAMADRNGVVEASVPGLADAARVSVARCRKVLDVLASPDADSRSQDFEGRRIKAVDGGWLLLNHARYRAKLEADEKRIQTAARVRRHRENRANVTPEVTHDQKSNDVTPSRSDPSPDPSPTPEAERESAQRDAAASDDETVIPLDLIERARSHSVFSDVAKALPGVTIEQLEDSAREFLTYWTIGEGTGRRRRQWMRKLREHLRRAFHENRLRAPGAIEHDARAPNGHRQAKSGSLADSLAFMREELERG